MSTTDTAPKLRHSSDPPDGISIPLGMMSYPDLPPLAKILFGWLCRFAGRNSYAAPAIGTLAACLGVSEKQTKHALQQLRAQKFIQIYSCEETGEPDVYVFIPHPALEICERRPRAAWVKPSVDRSVFRGRRG